MAELSGESAPGWSAIDQVLKPIYGDQQPIHVGTLIGWMLGGPDPLDGISVYRSDAGMRHWHFVSYGMSELYDKKSDNKEFSGWGFEFTFRLRREDEEQQPPRWVFGLLQNLARYVFQSGNVFDIGHHLDLNGPISLEHPDTGIVTVLIGADPELPPTDTPNGRLKFIQLFGATSDELNAARGWDTQKFLSLIQQHANPLLVTDLHRRSLLDEQELAEKVRERTLEEGSSTGALFVSALDWSRSQPRGVRIVVGAIAVPELKLLLSGRIPHGRGFVIASKDRQVSFEVGEQIQSSESATELRVTLTAESTRQLASGLRQAKGLYRSAVAPDLVFEVVPSSIVDRHGKVVRVVGE